MTGRLKEADERTKRELTDKCQENGWLRRGGYPWQDDPYLEDYPYDIREACTRISPSCSRSTAATSGGR